MTLTRRVLLAAGAGALGLSATAAAGDRDPCTESNDCQRGCGRDTAVCTYRCGQKMPSEHEWWDSVLTIQNCGDCTRKLDFGTSGEQSIHRDHAPDTRVERWTYYPKPGERLSVYFTGSVRTLDLEHGDLNVGITQRSQQDAHHCK